MTIIRRRALCAAILALAACAAPLAQAQDYPSKPITLAMSRLLLNR